MNRDGRSERNDATRLDTALKRSLVGFIIVMVFFLQVTSVVGETQTVDEGAHLAAGVSYWVRQDFRMNPEHPPLLKLLAALPLLPFSPELVSGPAWTEADEWAFGDAFLYQNRFSPDTLLLLGRLPLLLVSLLLPLAVFLVVRKRSGWSLGVLALLLVAFEPTFLAHSRYVTTDVGATLSMFAATVTFAWFLNSPQWKRLAIAGVVLGISLLTKFSVVILVPIFLFLLLLRRPAAGLPTVWSLIGLLVITGFTVWAGYGFQTNRPIDDPKVIQLLAAAETARVGRTTFDDPLLNHLVRLSDPTTPSGRRVRSILAAPIPAYGYIRGAIQVATHNRGGHESSLLGETRSRGRWNYFPIAFLVKEPLGYLVLVSFAVGWLASRSFVRFKGLKERFQRVTPFTLTCFAVAVAYLTLSLTSNLNLGIRHLLPLYPFLVLLIVAAAAQFWRSGKGFRIAVFSLATVAAISTLGVGPSYLAYFNEAVGGPRNGAHYLLDSNLDWGQDLKRLRNYVERTDVSAVCLVYFGRAKPASYRLDVLPFSERFATDVNGRPRCWTAVSASVLFNDPSPLLDEYRQREPFAKIGYSIYVFLPRTSQL